MHYPGDFISPKARGILALGAMTFALRVGRPGGIRIRQKGADDADQHRDLVQQGISQYRPERLLVTFPPTHIHYAGLCDDHVGDPTCTRQPERNPVLVLLSAKAGLRAAEIAGLAWDMLVDPTGTLTIRNPTGFHLETG
jgi:hypothetical protein